ncbi:hypothetical protein [Actinomadura rupiterrae]|uniref:hypothetical protein n=1 Tax=Actinomadura rupiterrae TaxID=559627 RepID=UPI0020A2AED4|nr:hypothetical protein [Actinomadura rupiterrae]MCP2343716.1 hypothetical protein [Actinomadura rupiterrae]
MQARSANPHPPSPSLVEEGDGCGVEPDGIGVGVVALDGGASALPGVAVTLGAAFGVGEGTGLRAEGVLAG